jgi:hypothetical protein
VAYVCFAAEERALFDITFLAGLDKSRHPELADAGTTLYDDLTPVAGRIAEDRESAFRPARPDLRPWAGPVPSAGRLCPAPGTPWQPSRSRPRVRLTPSSPSRSTPPEQEAAMPATTSDFERALERIGRGTYVSLTTFRENGSAVASPVGCIVHDGVLDALTPPGTGKVKRIRNSPHVTLPPCRVPQEPCAAARWTLVRPRLSRGAQWRW